MNGQLSIFDFTMLEIHIDKPIRLIELFAGLGSQAMALRDLGADFEHYRAVEFDRFAMASYNAIHGTKFEPTDIREIHGDDLGIVEKNRFTYLLTYSFPCQDLSCAGKGKGMKKGSGTRSGLLWEVERLLNETKELPDILLMENVPQVVGQNNIADFHMWQDFLVEKGYTNYVQIMNAKDYGVAQNRERCFMVSILGRYNFHFPDTIPLTKTISDYLEDNVDEKYYINSEKAQQLIDKLINNGETSGGGKGSALTIPLKTQEEMKLQIALSENMTTESQTENQKVPVLLKGMSGKEFEPGIEQRNIACALCARDYKGLNNYGLNGVLECQKKS